MASREVFFGDISFFSKIEEEVLSGVRPALPKETLKEYSTLVKSSWAHKPTDRPSFMEIKDWLLNMKQQHKLNVTLEEETTRTERKEVQVSDNKTEKTEKQEKIFETFQKKNVLPEFHESSVVSVCISEDSDSTFLLTGSSKGLLYKWDLNKLVIVNHSNEKSKHTKGINAILSLSQTKTIWTASADCTIRIWTKTLSLLKVIKAHRDTVNGLVLLNDTIVSCSLDGKVKFWSIKSFRCRRTLDLKMPLLCIQILNDLIWFGSNNHICYLDNNMVHSLKDAHKGIIYCLTLVRKKIWSCGSDKTIKIWKKNKKGTFELYKVLEGKKKK